MTLDDCERRVDELESEINVMDQRVEQLERELNDAYHTINLLSARLECKSNE